MGYFDDYEIITVDENIKDLDYYLGLLDTYKEKGIKRCFRYGGKILYPGITHQAAWYLCGSMPYEDFATGKENKEKLEDYISNRRDYIPEDDLRRIEEYKKVRAESPDGKKVIKENVISGLKFMAENKDISQDDFVKGLIDRGCLFTINDVRNEYEPFTRERFRDGHISAGAYVLANAKDSEASRRMLEDIFFSEDDDYSAYNFIRVTTGDMSYTKANIDSIKKKK